MKKKKYEAHVQLACLTIRVTAAGKREARKKVWEQLNKICRKRVVEHVDIEESLR